MGAGRSSFRSKQAVLGTLAVVLAGSANHAGLADSDPAGDSQQRCEALAAYAGWGVQVTTTRLTRVRRRLHKRGASRTIH